MLDILQDFSVPLLYNKQRVFEQPCSYRWVVPDIFLVSMPFEFDFYTIRNAFVLDLLHDKNRFKRDTKEESR
jgi:hypothetical protein